MAVTIRALTAGEAELLRTVRLRALAESPDAFAGTLAEATALPGHEWTRRAAAASRGKTETIVIAINEEGEPIGMAGGRVRDEPGVISLFGMWVDPVARGERLGAQLVEAVVGWAAARGAHTLRLGVMSDVIGSVRFYERLGFARAGEERPLTRDPARSWFEMLRSL